MITAKLITDAWAHCRTTNNSIPDEVLDFMKDISLAALQSQNSGKPIVSGSLPPDTEVEKWFAGEKVGDAKFWADAPFRENGDVVGIVIDALKHFMGGNDR